MLKVVNLNYPAQFMEEYAKRNFGERDSLVLENFSNFHLQYWPDTFKRRPLPRDIDSLVTDFGFPAGEGARGYAFGVRNMRHTAGSIFTFYGLKRDRRTETVLEIIIPHLHQVLCRLVNPWTKDKFLTAKEKEIVNWLKVGKTTWDISVLLGISERTVKFHVANVMRKLDASTRTHAVAIAMEQGLIDLD